MKYLHQFVTTFLNVGGGINASQTTGIVLQSLNNVDATKPSVACVTWADPLDTSVAEWITYTSINSTTNELQGVVRGAEGYSAKTHGNQAVVAFPLSKAHVNELNDAFLSNHASTGNLKSGAQINDTTADHQYVLAVSELTADRTITLPLLTGNDDFVFQAHGLTSSANANFTYTGVARQAITNGNFVVNQRVYVSNATLASGAYGHDRWKGGASGGDYTFTQLPSSTTITIKTGKSLIQVIETFNVIGGTYTLSWTGTAQARFGIDSATPSGAYAASPITITTQTAGTVMSVEFNEGTLGKAQLNSGSVALPFQAKSFEDELRACQRYYEKSYNYATAIGAAESSGRAIMPMSTCAAATTFRVWIPFKVKKRTTSPTVTFYGPVAGTSGKAHCYDGADREVNCTTTEVGMSGVYSAITTPNNAGAATVFISVHYTASDEL